MKKGVYSINPSADCPQCGKEFSKARPLKNGRSQGYKHDQVHCSTACSNRSRNKGHLDKNGYRIIGRTTGGKDIYEHRSVMEKMIGRPLLPRETVHHRNGARSDNRPENLELWSNRHGKGQRVEEKVEHALEMLRLYAPHLMKNEGAECEVVSISDYINATLCMVS